ncbi:hypothetical protein ACSS6W_004099 [Trichoderma asperelloides]
MFKPLLCGVVAADRVQRALTRRCHDGGSLHTKLLIWHVSMRQLRDAMRRKQRIQNIVIIVKTKNNAAIMLLLNRSIHPSIHLVVQQSPSSARR